MEAHEGHDTERDQIDTWGASRVHTRVIETEACPVCKIEMVKSGVEGTGICPMCDFSHYSNSSPN